MSCIPYIRECITCGSKLRILDVPLWVTCRFIGDQNNRGNSAQHESLHRSYILWAFQWILLLLNLGWRQYVSTSLMSMGLHKLAVNPVLMNLQHGSIALNHRYRFSSYELKAISHSYSYQLLDDSSWYFSQRSFFPCSFLSVITQEKK